MLKPRVEKFQSLLDQDFKDRKLKENEIIKATVTEITKNFIVVDCKAKMEGMIPIEEFKNDEELTQKRIEAGAMVETTVMTPMTSEAVTNFSG